MIEHLQILYSNHIIGYVRPYFLNMHPVKTFCSFSIHLAYEILCIFQIKLAYSNMNLISVTNALVNIVVLCLLKKIN